MKLYRELASLVRARLNCEETGNREWFQKYEERIEELVKNYMPSGSGFDCGTKIDLDKSTPEKLVFYTDFHHMNEVGYYDGWTEHRITVRPSLAFGFTLTISGRNRNEIKDYIHQAFDCALNEEIK